MYSFNIQALLYLTNSTKKKILRVQVLELRTWHYYRVLWWAMLLSVSRQLVLARHLVMLGLGHHVVIRDVMLGSIPGQHHHRHQPFWSTFCDVPDVLTAHRNFVRRKATHAHCHARHHDTALRSLPSSYVSVCVSGGKWSQVRLGRLLREKLCVGLVAPRGHPYRRW